MLCICGCACVHVWVYLHTKMRTHTNTQTQQRSCVNTCACVYHVSVRVYTGIHTQIRTHTYKYTSATNKYTHKQCTTRIGETCRHTQKVQNTPDIFGFALHLRRFVSASLRSQQAAVRSFGTFRPRPFEPPVSVCARVECVCDRERVKEGERK